MPESFAGLSAAVRHHAQHRPDRVALVGRDRRLTWRELTVGASRAAQALRAAGAVEGDRVTLQLPTGVEFVLLYLGALRAGLVVVPLNPALTAAETDYARADSGATVHVGVDSAAALVAQAADGGAADDVDLGPDRSDEATAVLLYTSGTSGRPKGAMLSTRALVGNLEQLAAVQPALLGPDDVLLLPLPLTHIFGLNAGLGMALWVGATAVLVDRFDAGETLALMMTERVSAVVGVPGQFAQWLSHPQARAAFGAVRLVLSGSAALPAVLADGFARFGVTLHDGYGLTEAAPVVTLTALGGPGARPTPGSIGRPVPGVQVELRDADGDRLDDEDDPGRIFIRGANLFSGYWPDGSDGPDADGWFGTGDLAVRDDAGELHLVGRATDLVIVNGFNVYPAEVEAVLAALPGVAEVAVVGGPDEETGEAVRAFVVPAPGMRLDPDELLARAAGSLARFKLPRRIEVVDALPHTVTGKVMKWRLDPIGGAREEVGDAGT